MTRKLRALAPALLLASALAIALTATATASHTTSELVSTGPNGGNGAFDSLMATPSTDGLTSFFETQEQLVATDTDAQFDVYKRQGSVTTKLSSGNGAIPVAFKGSSANGDRAFFETTESLVGADTDAVTDVYQNLGGTVTLLSQSSAGANGALAATYKGQTPDGTRVYFETSSSLAAGDMDSSRDVYERNGSTTTLVSTGSGTGNGAFGASFVDVNAAGTRVLFDTREQMVSSDDTDSNLDIYERSSGATTRISAAAIGGNAAFDAFYAGSSDDGTRVFFHTREPLMGTDSDTAFDVYERDVPGSATTRTSTGAGGGNGAFDSLLQFVSSNGTRAIFETSESLHGSDSDAQTDVYERTSGTTNLLSQGTQTGVGTFQPLFKGATPDATRIYIETTEALESTDTDLQADVYERTGSTTTQVSLGSAGGNDPLPAGFDAVNSTGSRILFHTDESLEPNDSDSFADVYERSAGVTSIVSGGIAAGNGNNFADFAGASEDLSRVFFHTDEKLSSLDTDSALDVYVAFTAANYPRPGGGTPLRVPFVPAFAQCTSPNSFHVAPALGGGSQDSSCDPPVRESALLTTSSVGAGQGSARLDVVVGNPATTADEADLKIASTLTDVRNVSDGSDYTGRVLLSSQLRITDRSNGSFETTPATTADTSFSVPILCVATGGANGANCTITTTADTLVPGFAKEGARAAIAALQMHVKDAGADGNVLTATCPPTCGTGDEFTYLRQGVFAP